MNCNIEKSALFNMWILSNSQQTLPRNYIRSVVDTLFQGMNSGHAEGLTYSSQERMQMQGKMAFTVVWASCWCRKCIWNHSDFVCGVDWNTGGSGTGFIPLSSINAQVNQSLRRDFWINGTSFKAWRPKLRAMNAGRVATALGSDLNKISRTPVR